MERLYTIPLRKEFQKVPNYKRTSKAIKAIRNFAQKHMKCDNVKIGKHLNLEIWKHGIKNPPHHIQVKAVKDKKGLVKVELVGAPTKEKVPSILRKSRAKFEKKEKKKKEEEKKKKEDTKKETAVEKKVEDKKQEEVKKVKKEELKTIQKEQVKAAPPKKDVKESNVLKQPNAPLDKKF